MTVSYNSLWHRDGRICHILRREYVQTEEDMNEKCIMQGEAWYLKWKRVEKWCWFVKKKLFREKDFIAHPKPNGYRSYHMILKMPVRFLGNTSETAALPCLEVQIRTIAMDCWASIEHELKYKHDIANPELMQQELKHCSDQIASTDLSLSTLKELILTPNADPDANSNTSAGAEKPVASDCRGIPLG